MEAKDHDEEVNVLTIELSDAPIKERDEDKPGVILDYDKDENIVGIEFSMLQNGCRIQNLSNTRLPNRPFRTGQPAMIQKPS